MLKIVFLVYVTKRSIAMKIRIKGNSVRFRLTRSEVDSFCRTGKIEERTNLNGGVFSYSVRLDENVRELMAEFHDNTISLLLPEKILGDWDTNDQVGFQNTLRLENGDMLFLLLEKDFACLDNTIEDQSDNYPNPKAS